MTTNYSSRLNRIRNSVTENLQNSVSKGKLLAIAGVTGLTLGISGIVGGYLINEYRNSNDYKPTVERPMETSTPEPTIVYTPTPEATKTVEPTQTSEPTVEPTYTSSIPTTTPPQETTPEPTPVSKTVTLDASEKVKVSYETDGTTTDELETKYPIGEINRMINNLKKYQGIDKDFTVTIISDESDYDKIQVSGYGLEYNFDPTKGINDETMENVIRQISEQDIKGLNTSEKWLIEGMSVVSRYAVYGDIDKIGLQDRSFLSYSYKNLTNDKNIFIEDGMLDNELIGELFYLGLQDYNVDIPEFNNTVKEKSDNGILITENEIKDIAREVSNVDISELLELLKPGIDWNQTFNSEGAKEYFEENPEYATEDTSWVH